jgi:hypothetical protein
MVQSTTIKKKSSSMKQQSPPKEAEDPVALARAAARQKYENCTISWTPPPPRTKESEWRKPLWVTSHPASGASTPSKKGDVVKALINSVTGLGNGGTKNYHMSMRNRLRRCKGMSETAACSQGHPYVPVGPEKQTANFATSVIFVLRNFATAFPASHTDKGMAYHSAKGQAPEDQWRMVRDQHLKGAFKTWKEMILWWKQADYYQIALYVPFEHLLDPTMGPTLVQRLADPFQSAGFDVAPAPDLPCLWYQAVKPEWARQHALMEYVPGYTKEQRDFLLQELQDFQKQVQGDDDLVAILKEYFAEIRDHTRLDVAFSENNDDNQTTTTSRRRR